MQRLGFFGLAVAAWMFLVPPVEARANDGPPAFRHLESGFELLRTGQASQAVRHWTRGGLLESAADPDFPRRFEADTAPMGRYEAREYLEFLDTGGGSTLVYAAIRFERGTLFVKFVAFEGAWRTSVNVLDWDVDPARLLPPHLLDPRP